jgi:hypothetical protein
MKMLQAQSAQQRRQFGATAFGVERTRITRKKKEAPTSR